MKTSGSRTPHVAPSRFRTEVFSRFARFVSGLSAHPATFALAVLAVIGWAACGPVTHYSEIWQLWINTSTTILTFLMVFLLQNAQMRDTKALHMKMDELLRTVHGARSALIDLENLSEEELNRYAAEFSRLHQRYTDAVAHRRKKLPRSDDPGASHSH